jgi:hypothetical protein
MDNKPKPFQLKKIISTQIKKKEEPNPVFKLSPNKDTSRSKGHITTQTRLVEKSQVIEENNKKNKAEEGKSSYYISFKRANQNAEQIVT